MTRANNAVPILCTQPAGHVTDPEARDYPKGFRGIAPIVFPDYRHFNEMWAAWNGTVKEVGQDLDVLIFDADVLMPRDNRLFSDMIHLTDEGCREYARLLLELLVAEGAIG